MQPWENYRGVSLKYNLFYLDFRKNRLQREKSEREQQERDAPPSSKCEILHVFNRTTYDFATSGEILQLS